MVKKDYYRNAARKKKTKGSEFITCEEETSISRRKRNRKSSRKKSSTLKNVSSSLDNRKAKRKGARPKTYIRDDSAKDVEADIESAKDLMTPTSEKVIGVEWAKSMCRKGLRPLLKEFAVIRKFIPPEMTTTDFNQYPTKNRYTDVMCLDKTRVILKGRPKNNDYIHASWVQLPSNRRYICTQGPLDETVEDFWLMILKEEVQAIVMLCDFLEDGDVKCAEYYPMTVGEKAQYGDITVKNDSNGESIETITSQLLTVKSEDEKLSVHHYKWLGWPDRSAPSKTSPLLGLLAKLKGMHGKGPIVVHCSAGIGRTGTFCAVDYTIDRLNDGSVISIPDIVKEIRKQRLHSVQSVLQYLYLHLCVVDYLLSSKMLPRDLTVRRFQRSYEKYLKKYNERLSKEKLSEGQNS